MISHCFHFIVALRINLSKRALINYTQGVLIRLGTFLLLFLLSSPGHLTTKQDECSSPRRENSTTTFDDDVVRLGRIE